MGSVASYVVQNFVSCHLHSFSVVLVYHECEYICLIVQMVQQSAIHQEILLCCNTVLWYALIYDDALWEKETDVIII